MENKIKLTLMGLSYNPLQEGAFAMLLAAEGSTKRIPIIIGASEAQAIAVEIEQIKPQRPMTHDLFATMAHAFGIELKEVFIYSFVDGIFAAEMTFSDGERQITLDSRTSDAVAVALRTGAPIYTTRAILDETGIEFVEVDDDESEAAVERDDSENTDYSESPDYSPSDASDYQSMSYEELSQQLEQAIDDDRFEDAALIRKILDSRQ